MNMTSVKYVMWIFNDFLVLVIVIHVTFLQDAVCQKLSKLTNVARSYSENKSGGKRLSTCPQILVIQKAFLQRFTSHELLSVIKLLVFLLFFG